ncbi:hypothetical protein K3495_g12924 [Podosphaera aphanis]|nr:hypothetical protein K3495_g12924 [Podosphaera aphanis]
MKYITQTFINLSPPDAYDIDEAEDDELSEIWEILSWVCEKFTARWQLPDVVFYMLIEGKTEKIVEWAALQFSWTFRGASMTEELKDKAKSKELPTGLEDAFNYGYDPQMTIVRFKFLTYKKYQRRPTKLLDRLGTMIRPEFQKKGLGTYLTKLLNGLADADGSKSWVSARPSVVKMFQENGYKDVGSSADSHLER